MVASRDTAPAAPLNSLPSRYNRSREMEDSTQEQITLRAYRLWEQAGKPEGRDKEFYRQAEQEFHNQDKVSPEPDIL